MRIGILGTGSMAASLGGAWVRAGHDVVVGGRDPRAAARTAARAGAAGHGALRDAADHGEAVLVALPAAAGPDVVKGLPLDGRTVIDCSNALAPEEGGLMLSPGSAAQRLAEAVPGAHVVKAFNLCHESVWTLPRPEFEGAALAVPYCGEDPGDRVAALIGSMGCTPLPCGGLDRAPYLEATAALAIGIWWAGGEPRFALPSPGEVTAG
ncbi:NAD(P)-binding domain-containing protein [Streptomyces sp. NPDC051940]|uniref:NADPH-dependent F420 reductase n=1 Tax=Streptomyces sp. NPDC051940 TaxID=3155675 RepID=UPI003440DD89